MAPPDPSRTSRVSLPQILAYAKLHAPAIRIAVSRMTLGRAEIRAASPLLPSDPQLTIKVGPRIAAAGRALDAQLILLQRFEIAGERGLRIDAAKRTRDRLRAQLSQVRWVTHQRVHAAFRRAQVARQRLEAARRLLAFAKRLLSIATRREAAGAIAGLEVQVVRGELAQARQAEIAAKNGYITARLLLAEIAGWPAGRPPQPAGDLPKPGPAPVVATLLAKAMAHHPALRTAAMGAAEALARSRLARREVTPKPALGVQINREGQVGTSATYIVMGWLSVPIPTWRRNQGAVALTRARVTVAKARHRALRQLLHARVVRAVASVRAAAKRVQIYGTNVIPTFESSLRMLQRAFQAGKIDVLQVMVARGRFLALQRQALSAYDDYYNAIANLEAVVGTDDWAARPRARR